MEEREPGMIETRPPSVMDRRGKVILTKGQLSMRRTEFKVKRIGQKTTPLDVIVFDATNSADLFKRGSTTQLPQSNKRRKFDNVSSSTQGETERDVHSEKRELGVSEEVWFRIVKRAGESLFYSEESHALFHDCLTRSADLCTIQWHANSMQTDHCKHLINYQSSSKNKKKKKTDVDSYIARVVSVARDESPRTLLLDRQCYERVMAVMAYQYTSWRESVISVTQVPNAMLGAVLACNVTLSCIFPRLSIEGKEYARFIACPNFVHGVVNYFNYVSDFNGDAEEEGEDSDRDSPEVEGETSSISTVGNAMKSVLKKGSGLVTLRQDRKLAVVSGVGYRTEQDIHPYALSCLVFTMVLKYMADRDERNRVTATEADTEELIELYRDCWMILGRNGESEREDMTALSCKFKELAEGLANLKRYLVRGYLEDWYDNEELETHADEPGLIWMKCTMNFFKGAHEKVLRHRKKSFTAHSRGKYVLIDEEDRDELGNHRLYFYLEDATPLSLHTSMSILENTFPTLVKWSDYSIFFDAERCYLVLKPQLRQDIQRVVIPYLHSNSSSIHRKKNACPIYPIIAHAFLSGRGESMYYAMKVMLKWFADIKSGSHDRSTWANLKTERDMNHLKRFPRLIAKYADRDRVWTKLTEPYKKNLWWGPLDYVKDKIATDPVLQRRLRDRLDRKPGTKKTPRIQGFNADVASIYHAMRAYMCTSAQHSIQALTLTDALRHLEHEEWFFERHSECNDLLQKLAGDNVGLDPELFINIPEDYLDDVDDPHMLIYDLCFDEEIKEDLALSLFEGMSLKCQKYRTNALRFSGHKEGIGNMDRLSGMISDELEAQGLFDSGTSQEGDLFVYFLESLERLAFHPINFGIEFATKNSDLFRGSPEVCVRPNDKDRWVRIDNSKIDGLTFPNVPLYFTNTGQETPVYTGQVFPLWPSEVIEFRPFVVSQRKTGKKQQHNRRIKAVFKDILPFLGSHHSLLDCIVNYPCVEVRHDGEAEEVFRESEAVQEERLHCSPLESETEEIAQRSPLESVDYSSESCEWK